MFGFDLNFSGREHPVGDLKSLQQIFEAVQCHKHLANREKFSIWTDVQCLDGGSHGSRTPKPVLKWARSQANRI
jgi:ribosomal protein L37AE/L43A